MLEILFLGGLSTAHFQFLPLGASGDSFLEIVVKLAEIYGGGVVGGFGAGEGLSDGRGGGALGGKG